MKNLSPKILISLFFLITVLSCDKDDGDINQIDLLPEKTQIGANTFGCLINGRAFVDNSGGFNCFYQLVDNDYYFYLGAEDDVESIIEIEIYSNMIELFVDTNYPLTEFDDNAGVSGFLTFKENQQTVSTSNDQNGYLRLSTINFSENIISGEFEFDMTHPLTGEIIEIREGRFDTFFNQ